MDENNSGSNSNPISYNRYVDSCQGSMILEMTIQNFLQINYEYFFHYQMIQNNEFTLPSLNSFKHHRTSSKNQQVQMGHYKINQQIGKGSYAKVYKATQLFTKVKVAAKVIQLDGILHRQLQKVKRQIDLHKKMDHPFIARFYEDVWTDSKVYIFMELVKGKQLLSYLQDNGPLKQPVALKIFFQLVSAIKYMHQMNIAHRDIKAENIMIDSELNIKIIDFGFAKQLTDALPNATSTFCGSFIYMSPQIINKSKYSERLNDVWCLGVVLYMMLENSFPFDSDQKSIISQSITKLKWQKPIHSSKEAENIYEQIFKFQNQRIDLQTIQKQKLFTKYNFSFKQLRKTENCKINKQQIYNVCTIFQKNLQQVQNIIKNKQNGAVYSVYSILNESSKEKQRKMDNNKIKQYGLKSQKLKTKRFSINIRSKASKQKQVKNLIHEIILNPFKIRNQGSQVPMKTASLKKQKNQKYILNAQRTDMGIQNIKRCKRFQTNDNQQISETSLNLISNLFESKVLRQNKTKMVFKDMYKY